MRDGMLTGVFGDAGNGILELFGIDACVSAPAPVRPLPFPTGAAEPELRRAPADPGFVEAA